MVQRPCSKVLGLLDSPLLNLRVSFIILTSLQGGNICDCIYCLGELCFSPIS